MGQSINTPRLYCLELNSTDISNGLWEKGRKKEGRVALNYLIISTSICLLNVRWTIRVFIRLIDFVIAGCLLLLLRWGWRFLGVLQLLLFIILPPTKKGIDERPNQLVNTKSVASMTSSSLTKACCIRTIPFDYHRPHNCKYSLLPFIVIQLHLT